MQKYSSQGLCGGNFHLLPVKDATVPDPYLSPFRKIQFARSILRKRSRYSAGSGSSRKKRARDENYDSGNQRNPDGSWRGSQSSVKPVESDAEVFPSQESIGTPSKPARKSVQFSPYNKVQLMSPRKGGSTLQFIEEEDEISSDDERSVFSESVVDDEEELFLSPGA